MITEQNFEGEGGGLVPYVLANTKSQSTKWPSLFFLACCRYGISENFAVFMAGVKVRAWRTNRLVRARDKTNTREKLNVNLDAGSKNKVGWRRSGVCSWESSSMNWRDSMVLQKV